MKARAILLLSTGLLGLPGCDRAGPLGRSRGGDSEASGAIPAIERAIEAHYAGDYAGARSILSTLVVGSEASNDTATLARALTWIGLGHWREGDLAAARAMQDRALALQLESSHDEEIFRTYNALGLLAWGEGRLAEADRYFEESMAEARAVGDDLGEASAAGNLGLVKTDLGEIDAARALFGSLRGAGRRLDDPRREANALTNLGMLEVRVGRPRSAVPTLQEALRLHRESSHPPGVENTLAQLGTAFAAMGELGRAHAYYDSALVVAREVGMAEAEAQDLELLAELYQKAGDLNRALETYRAAEAVHDRIEARYEAGLNTRAEAEILLERGDPGTAHERAAAALELHREIGEPMAIVQDLVTLAEIETDMGRREAASARLEEAATIASAYGTPGALRLVALARARAADRRGDPAETLSLLSDPSEALADGGPEVEWQVHSLRARAFGRLARWDLARSAAVEAVRAVERIRRSLSSGPLRTSYAAARRETYGTLVETLLLAGEVESALSAADAASAGALRQHLAALGETRSSLDPATADLVGAEEALRRIDQVVASLDDPYYRADAETLATLRSRLGDAREAHAEMESGAAERDPGSGAFLGIAPLDVAAVQATLGRGEVLLQYFVRDDRVYLFVVAEGGVSVEEIPEPRDRLANRVRLASDWLSQPSPQGTAPSVLLRLHELLIAPALRHASVRAARRWVIVPHDVLTYLPFAALRRPDGRHVVEQVPILTLPSAAALPLLRRADRGRAGSTVGAATFAPFPVALPATVEETRVVARQLDATEVFMGSAATEDELRRALAGRRLVHIASHAEMNRRNPLFSRIELVPGEGGGADDGRLEAHELLATHIAADLVFLSGCETGIGPALATGFSPGADYATLAQSFLLRGAGNVVATLWRVSDRGSARFAERFYRALATASPAEALAQAQREMLSDPEFAAPWYWAGYQVLGSDRIANQVTTAVP